MSEFKNFIKKIKKETKRVEKTSSKYDELEQLFKGIMRSQIELDKVDKLYFKEDK